RARIRAGAVTPRYVAVRALAPVGSPIEGLFTVRPEGSTAIHVPWLITARPKRDALISSLRLSSERFEPSDTAPTVLSFQAGRIAAGGQLEPVALLELKLRGPDGKRVWHLPQVLQL